MTADRTPDTGTRGHALERSPGARLELLADGALCLSVGVAAFLLYLSTAAPTVGGTINSAEYQHAAYGLQIAHPPGYPLYLLLGKLWMTIVPLGEPARRLTIFSSATMAIAVAGAYLGGRAMSDSRTAGLLAAALFATAQSVWRQASVAEVDALNALLVAAAFLTYYGWLVRRFPLELPALLLGLALANHRTSAFYLLVLGLAAGWISVWRREPLPHILRAAGLLVAPLILYLYVPLRAWTSPWYANTWDGFVTMVTARDAGRWLQIALADGLESRWRYVGVELLWPMIGWAGALLALAGFLGCAVRTPIHSRGAPGAKPGIEPDELPVFARAPATAIVWGLSALLMVGFAVLYDIDDIDRYLIVPLWLVFTWAGVGLGWLRNVVRRRPLGLLLAWLVTIAAFTQPLTAVQLNRSGVDFSLHFQERDRWDAALRAPLEPDALIMGSWIDINDVRYFQAVEGRRRDLTTLEATISPAEYLSLMRGRLEAGKATYVADYPADPSSEFAYKPVGTVWQVVRTREALPVKRNLDARLADRLHLVTVEQSDPRIDPRGTLEIRLRWIADSPLTGKLTPWLTVVGAAGNAVSNIPRAINGMGNVEHWPPGTEVVTEHGIFVPESLRPGRYQVHLSLRDAFDRALPAYDAAGRSIGDGVVVATFVRPAAELHESLSNASGVAFGDSMWLTGCRLSILDIDSERALHVFPTWQSTQHKDVDYTVSVQILDSAGHVITQEDQQPRRGEFPTSSWLPGERVSDEVRVPLPASLPAGQYRVLLVVYQLETGERLKTSTGDLAVLGRIVVGANQEAQAGVEPEEICS